MCNSEVKLLGVWYSPYVIRPRIALNLKSIDYEFIEENLFGNSKSELLLKSNPVHKKVPVLIHGDNNQSICESLIIVQYVDEAFQSGPSIFPSDPYDRAVARFWAAYIDDKWFPSVKVVGITKSEEARKAAVIEVEEGLILLEEAFINISKGKDFFGGDQIGFLDIALGSFIVLLKATETLKQVKLFDETKIPVLFKWGDKFCSVPAVKSVIPQTEKLLKFLEELEEMVKLRSSTNN